MTPQPPPTVRIETVAEAMLHQVEQAMLAEALGLTGPEITGPEPIRDPMGEAMVRWTLWPPTGWAPIERTLARRVGVTLPALDALIRGDVDLEDFVIPRMNVVLAPGIADEVARMKGGQRTVVDGVAEMARACAEGLRACGVAAEGTAAEMETLGRRVAEVSEPSPTREDLHHRLAALCNAAGGQIPAPPMRGRGGQ